MDVSDGIIFFGVVGLRFLVPFAILRYPLPAIITALVLDAVDQTIFQQYTNIDLEKFNYQGYDKALDVFYLVIAMFAAMRNWRPLMPVAMAIGLLYYRLLGVVLFESTGWRPILLIFPNTFEYFFIYIAYVHMHWSLERLSRRHVIGAAAFIWIFIKLPQEAWIHVFQLDTTDVVKEHIFGVATDASWADALTNRPFVTILLLAIVIGLILVVRTILSRLPEHEYEASVRKDAIEEVSGYWVKRTRPWTWYHQLVERVWLIVVVSIIFALGLEANVSAWRLTFGIAAVAVINAAFVSAYGIGRSGSNLVIRLVTQLALNAAILVGLYWLLPTDAPSRFVTPAFFLLMLTIMVTLFDAYRAPRPQFHELMRVLFGKTVSTPPAHTGTG